MKRKAIILAMAVLLAMSAAAQTTLGQVVKQRQIEGVSTIIMGKSLFRLLGKGSVGVGPMGGVNVDKLVNKLDRIEVISAEKKSAVKELRKLIEPIFKSIDYDVIIDVAEEKEHTLVAVKEHTDGKNEIVLVSDEGKEINVVVMLGCITLDDLQDDSPTSAPPATTEPIAVDSI